MLTVFGLTIDEALQAAWIAGLQQGQKEMEGAFNRLGMFRREANGSGGQVGETGQPGRLGIL